MSSQTQTRQQLYKAEADVLAKENATLQAKNEELEAMNKLLQCQVKDAEERTSAALHGKLTELKPFVDETIRKEVAISSAGLSDRIQNLETELTEVQALNTALTQELQNTLLVNENLASYLMAKKERLSQASHQALLMHNMLEYELSEAEGPETKFLNNNTGLRRRFNIQALQTALDSTDRHRISGDVKMIEELEAKNKLLQCQVRNAEERTLLAIHGKYKEFKQFLDGAVKRDMAKALARLGDREKEIENLKAEIMEAQALNNALLLCIQAQGRESLASAVKHLEELILSLSEDLGSLPSPPSQEAKDEAEFLSKLIGVCDLARRKIGALLPEKPAKPSRSPAETEMIRLKNRQTLHSLDR